MRRRILIIVALMSAAALVMGTRDLLSIRADLQRLRTQLEPAPAAAGSLDLPALADITNRASSSAEHARNTSRSTVLAGAARVPILGRTVRTVRALAEAAADAVDGARSLVDGLEAFPLVDGRLDYGLQDGRLELEPWVRAGPAARRAVASITRAEIALADDPGSFVVPAVSDARMTTLVYLHNLGSAARAFDDGARLLPSMLGASERRRYLVVLQNLSEQRATGGIPGGTVIIEADRGKLELKDVASNLYIDEAEEDIPAPSWFRRRYDRYASRRLWVNANAEANFPDTAPLLGELYRSIVGRAVDGVIAIDPLALKGFMGVTGSVQDPTGLAVTAEDIVPLISSEAYVKFPGAHGNLPRKRYFEALAATIWERFSTGAELSSMSEAVAAAVSGKHVLMWSSRPEEQAVIARLGAAGIVGTTGGGAQGFAMITQSASANKMDYYLRREIDVVVRPVDGLVRVKTTVLLRNTGPASGIPPYVLGQTRDVPTYRPGFIRTYFSAYLPPGAFVHGLTVDGKPSIHESERAPHALILSDFVTVYPGQQRRIVVDWSLSVPGDEGSLSLVLQKQPTVVPDQVSVIYQAKGGGSGLQLVPGGPQDGDVEMAIPYAGGVFRRLSSILTGG